MSWRVVFEPYPWKPDDFGDWRIPEHADHAEIHRIADLAKWNLPMKLFMKNQDARYQEFCRYLKVEYGMGGNDYRVFVSDGMSVDEIEERVA